MIVAMSEAKRLVPSRLTLHEFLDWNPPGPDRWQLADGEPVAMAPASDRHGAIQAELGRLIGNHLVDAGSDCRVVANLGVVPRSRASNNFRIPDIGVTCPGGDTAVPHSDPVLLVEILSPSNEAETRSNVWAYCTIPTVREILLVHVSRVEAELLRRDADTSWPPDPVVLQAGDRLVLDSIGFDAPLQAIYRTAGLHQSR